MKSSRNRMKFSLTITTKHDSDSNYEGPLKTQIFSDINMDLCVNTFFSFYFRILRGVQTFWFHVMTLPHANHDLRCALSPRRCSPCLLVVSLPTPIPKEY